MASTSDLELEYDIFVPREILFEIWTTAEHLVCWYSPDADCTREAQVDLRPGGAYRFAWRDASGRQFIQRGEFIAVEPPERLEYSMIFDGAFGAEFETRVTVLFVGAGDAAQIQIRQSGFPDADVCERCRAGWRQFLHQLEAYLAVI